MASAPAFDVVPVQGIPDNSYTSLQFGPDGRLYAADRFGDIFSFEIKQTVDPTTGAVAFAAIDTNVITSIASIPNHNDDGSLAPTVLGRQVTGIAVTGTPGQPVIYVSSSDPRVGGFGAGDVNLDTNSGMISKLTWNGTGWDEIDLVRGLPRSEVNHSTNGLVLGVDPNTHDAMLYVAQGGNTNAGAPSADFGNLNEYALSSAILSVDLTTLAKMPVQSDGHVYDLPTVLGTSTPFGGMDGLNQARLVLDGPVQVYSSGYRNPYDLVITTDGHMFTIDNGANAGTGGLPMNEGTPQVTNQIPTSDPNGLNIISSDNLQYVYQGFYAGHPNPTRADPGGAGDLYGSTGQEAWIASPAGNWPPVDPTFSFASNAHYLIPGVQDGALTTWSSSTDGLDEYTASNFGGALAGNLIATSFDDSIYRIVLSSDYTSATKEVLASGLNGTPLDVTAEGNLDPFPGTMWVAFLDGGSEISALVPTVGNRTPQAPTNLDLASEDDLGTSHTDNVTAKSTGLTITGTGEYGSTVTLFDDINHNGSWDSSIDTVLGTGAVNAGSFNIDVALSAGTHQLAAFQTQGGNISSSSTSLAITVDTVAPATLFTSESAGSGKNGKLTLAGTSEHNSSITVWEGSTKLGTVGSADDGTWNFLGGRATDSIHVYRTTTTDIAGNDAIGLNSAILGSSRSDTIIGSSGNDLIVGGAGGDMISGNGGSDTFRYLTTSDSRPGSKNFDTIRDFVEGHDHIDFSAIPGLSNAISTSSTPKSIAPHTIELVNVGANTIVYANASGSNETLAHADMEIHVLGVHLTSFDLLL